MVTYKRIYHKDLWISGSNIVSRFYLDQYEKDNSHFDIHMMNHIFGKNVHVLYHLQAKKDKQNTCKFKW